MTQRTLAPICAFLLLTSLFGSGCGNNTRALDASNAGQGCSGGSAIISVYDGALGDLCGCQESGAFLHSGGTPLTCTVPSGTQVLFQYTSAQLLHQIVSVGAPSFCSSPVHDVNANFQIPFHGVVLTTPGTYRFQDSFDSGLQGLIVVQ